MTDSHCPYCALQCAMTLRPAAAGDSADAGLTITGRDFPTNRGGLCRKGATAGAVLSAPDRLTTPLLRDADGILQPVSWETALGHIADRLRALRAEHGPDAVAVFGGGGLTNEKAYSLGKFARAVLGTRFVDYNGRFCMSSAAAAGNRAFGLDRGLPFPLTDLDDADVVLLVGSNPAETMPPFVPHLSRARDRGGLVVIDPRRTPTAALTGDGGGVHLQPLPGTDLQLLLGLLHLIFALGPDEAYLADRVEGVGAVRAAARLWWPERVEEQTGVSAHDLRRVAALLRAAAPMAGGRCFVLTGRGAEQHAHGTDTVTAAINLALALGLPGRLGCGYGTLTGQGNGQGGREHGQKADQLPGYRSITDPAARAQVAAVWGIDPVSLPGPGLPAVDLLRSLGRPGMPRALLVHGSNLLVGAPDTAVVRERLAALDLLVVADVVPSETALVADVVLPVTQWAQEDGTMTNLEGRIIRRRKAIDPTTGVRSELHIWAELAERLDSPVVMRTEPSEVFTELARASAGGPADYSGVSYALLDRGEPVYWPCPALPSPGGVAATPQTPDPAVHGTPRPFTHRFATTDGRARMIAVEPSPVADERRADAPYSLLTGRILEHYQSGAQTRRVPDLATAAPEAFVQLHPSTAATLDIGEGEPVDVRSARGTVVAPARLSVDIRPECVFVPFHFGGPQTANLVTSPATDPISGMPEFKVCAVQVRPAGPAAAHG